MTRLPLSSPRLLAQQFGFLKNRSSLTQMVLFFSIIFEAINSGKICDVIPHNKLTSVQIKKYRIYWLPSDRYHFVFVNGGSSEHLKVVRTTARECAWSMVIYSKYQ